MNNTTALPSLSLSFITSTAQLALALSKLVPFLREQVILPILINAYCRIEHGVLFITLYNLTDCVTVEVLVEQDRPAEINSPFLIPIKLLYDLLSTLEQQPIDCSLGVDTADDEHLSTLLLITSNATYSFTLENPADFPALPSIEFSASKPIPAKELKAVLSILHSFCSTDDLRPAMGGLLWDIRYNVLSNKTTHVFFATDGHRLVKLKRDFGMPDYKGTFPLDQKRLIHRQSVRSLATILPGPPAKGRPEPDPVEVWFSDTHMQFEWGRQTVIIKLMTEKPVDYTHGLPGPNSVTVTTGRKQLLSAIRRGKLFADPSTQAVSMLFGDKSIQIESHHTDKRNKLSESVLSTIHTKDSTEPLKIGFNATKLMALLSAIPDSIITIGGTKSNRAIVVNPVEPTTVEDIYLLMPVMLDYYEN